MLKKIFDNTNTITSRIASISINLVVIGISAVLLLGAVDTLRTKFKKSKKTEKFETIDERREAYAKLRQGESAEQCADYAEKDVSVIEEAKESFRKFNKDLEDGVITFDDKKGTVKKSLKKKVSKPAEVDKPEDLPAPNTESQE